MTLHIGGLRGRLLEAAFERTDGALVALGVTATGPGTASFANTVFASHGEVTCAVAAPVGELDAVPVEGITMGTTPAGVFLAATHRGSYRTIGDTYTFLGTHVDGLAVGAKGRVVERYLVAEGETTSLRTEVCWPVLG